jgi:18S rRNA (adenine1779-N6/adenine1780-N6)-dimethyltransferase
MGKSEQGKRNNAAGGGLPYSSVKSTNVFKFNTNLGQHVLKNPGGRFSIWLLVALE